MGTRKSVGVDYFLIVACWWCIGGWVCTYHQTLAWQVVRYRARVAYDGTSFQGFQIQGSNKVVDDKNCNGITHQNRKDKQQRTVQGELETVLSTRWNQPVRVVAAGRTDAGVHARGQAIHFDVNVSETPTDHASLERSLARMLPTDVTLWNLQFAPSARTKLVDGQERVLPWNVMYDNTHKLYSYRLSTAAVMDPLSRQHRWHPDNVDAFVVGKAGLAQLTRLLKHYEGTHDFRAFASAMEQLEKHSDGPIDTVRTVYSVNVVPEANEGDVRIDFVLKGALYKQVRNMVGTVLETCRGEIMKESDMLRLLQDATASGLSRADNPSKPAPPQGLTLENVYFGDDEDCEF
jgi:tRNA pseudouridine38-40 synthase